MTYKDKKSALIRALQKIKKLATLSTLLDELGEGFSERSVRRWLVELCHEGIVEKVGQKNTTKYRIAEQSSIDVQGFSDESKVTVALVRAPLQKRMPVAYQADWLDSYQPNKSFYISQKYRVHLSTTGKRSMNGDPAGTYAHHIYNRLLIDLSYNSSRLEGNTYSLLDTQKLVLEGKSASGKMEQEELMILNHKEAIRYLVDRAAQIEIQTKTICTIHYLLSEGLVDRHFCGIIRDCGARIGGSSYIPYENPKDLKKTLDLITEKAAQIEDPFEQSFFLLVHLSYIQAFIDVNKRTARLSANIPLIKNNFVPLSFNDIDKDDYTSAILAIYELQDVHPLLDLFIFSYTRTCAAYDATIKAIGFDEIRARYRSQRRSLLREVILQKLHGVKMLHFIDTKTSKLVHKKDQKSFKEDVLEDIQEMDSSHIVGLGVTDEEFNLWAKKRSPHSKK